MYLLHEIFDLGVWDIKLFKLFDRLFVYSPPYSGCDCDKGFCVPSIVSYFINQWVIFGLFLCGGLFWESVVAICEFDVLCMCERVVKVCGCGLKLRLCRGCLALVWGSIGI